MKRREFLMVPAAAAVAPLVAKAEALPFVGVDLAAGPSVSVETAIMNGVVGQWARFTIYAPANISGRIRGWLGDPKDGNSVLMGTFPYSEGEHICHMHFVGEVNGKSFVWENVIDEDCDPDAAVIVSDCESQPIYGIASPDPLVTFEQEYMG